MAKRLAIDGFLTLCFLFDPLAEWTAKTGPWTSMKRTWRTTMKYLCLAYGAEEDWKALTKTEQEELLAADGGRDEGHHGACLERDSRSR